MMPRTLLIVTTLSMLSSVAMAAQPAAPTPVLVELFTSEGCSSCPPAEAKLRMLATTQPTDGVEVIPLAWSVDYWDSLGSHDPFSSHEFTDRQNEYAKRFGNPNVYTPEMIVDGKVEFDGNDFQRAKKEIAYAAKTAKTPIASSIEPSNAKDSARVKVHLSEPAATTADVVLVVTENDLTQKVRRGENVGRTLHHDAIVRVAKSLGRVEKGKTFEQSADVPLDPSWKRENLSIVVFAQTHDGLPMLGCARIALPK